MEFECKSAYLCNHCSVNSITAICVVSKKVDICVGSVVKRISDIKH